MRAVPELKKQDRLPELDSVDALDFLISAYHSPRPRPSWDLVDELEHPALKE